MHKRVLKIIYSSQVNCHHLLVHVGGIRTLCRSHDLTLAIVVEYESVLSSSLTSNMARRFFYHGHPSIFQRVNSSTYVFVVANGEPL